MRLEAMNSKNILSVSDLCVDFRSEGQWRPAVRDLSFDLRERETLAIVGESGSGKSVTALSLMQLLPKVNSRVRGQALFGGKDLLAMDEPCMQAMRGNEIAMIFQEPMTSLNPVLTIGEQIAESLRYHRLLRGAAAEAEVLRILDRVRIPSPKTRLNEYPHRFSGGMRQRVMIAMALACQPKVLIADEPTTALDVTVQAQILELIASLQAELGMSVIFITHDMGVVAEIADRTLVMRRGEKIEEAATPTLFVSPGKPYTRALLGAVPRLGSMRDETEPKALPVLDPETGELDPSIVVKLPSKTLSAAAATVPLLEVSQLCTRFDMRGGLFGRVQGRVHAVENVSFILAAGETLALVGESGCGKSTTGRSILRLVEPTSGMLRFEGHDLRGLDKQGLRAMRRQMQMIFQDPYASLDPRISVGEAIAEPIVVHGIASRKEARDHVAALLRKVGMPPDVAQRLPHEFSGGQRQRICIARALALKPRLIIADEAVSALDVSIKAQVLNLMIELQRELGLGYLFISHDMAVVERVAHRIAVMYLGEIVEIGPRAAIIGNPQHPYTQKLIAAVPVPNPALRGRRGKLAVEDLPSPVRAPHYQAPMRRWREISPGHLIQEKI
jgi:peptide/nickel transport system ATP-binding protein